MAGGSESGYNTTLSTQGDDVVTTTTVFNVHRSTSKLKGVFSKIGLFPASFYLFTSFQFSCQFVN